MPITHAAEAARHLVKKYGTRDPFIIAEELGITVIHWERFTRLKGMYRVILRNRYIFLNAALPEQTAALVCAHEIGHDRLHRDLATGGVLQEYKLYDTSSRPEYEANMFAAELLIDDGDILPLIEEGYSAEQIAAQLETNVNLIALKVESLSQAGHRFGHVDYQNRFLK